LKELKEEYSLSIRQIERLTSINKRYRFKSIELSITPSPDSLNGTDIMIKNFKDGGIGKERLILEETILIILKMQKIPMMIGCQAANLH